MAFEEKDLQELPVNEATEETVDTAEPEKKSPKFNLPKFTFKRDARRLRVGTAATVFTVVVVAAIFLLNIIVGIVEERWPCTIDTT